MSAIGELFINNELTETASNSNMLNILTEELIVPDGFYHIWNNEDIPSSGSINIIKKTRSKVENFDIIKFEVEHFVDDWGYGKFINYYIKKIERNNTTKLFKKNGL